MACQVDEGTIVNDAFRLPFADNGGLHPVVKHLPGSATKSLEGCDMASQDGWQVLMHDEARPDKAAVTQHHREQPDDPWRHWLVGEDNMELGEIDLSLLAGRRLEANLETRTCWRPHVAKKIRQCRVAAGIATLPEFSEQSTTGQAGIGLHPFPQVEGERINDRRTRLSGTVGRDLEAPLDIFAHRLAVDACFSGNS